MGKYYIGKGSLEVNGEKIADCKDVVLETMDAPQLNPDAGPQYHIPISKCNQCTPEPVVMGGIPLDAVGVFQDKEGWYYVVCTNCNRESTMRSADMNSAIRLWNEENGTN